MAKDLHSIWGHRWLIPKAKASKSDIHGLGVIAIKPILKGELVCVIGGIIIPTSQIKQYRKKMGHHHAGFQIDEDFFICPTTIGEYKETGVFNHSCEPNVGFVDSIKLVAIKNINKGEELAFDYAFSEIEFESFECNCGSKNCRKTITPDDWKIPELQRKYGKYFSPYLRAKFL